AAVGATNNGRMERARFGGACERAISRGERSMRRRIRRGSDARAGAPGIAEPAPRYGHVDSPAASVPLLRLPISVVVCSDSDAQYTAMAASYGHALAGWPYLHGSVIYPDGSGYRVTA